MRQRATGIMVGLILLCLSAGGQKSSWDELMNSGKAAMEKQQYAEAESAFREALNAAGQFGDKDARFSTALLFLAQACDAQTKGEEAETFARRAADGMEKSVKAHHPTSTEEQLKESDVASAIFDKAGDIFAAHQQDAEAAKFYERVVKTRAAAVAVEQEDEKNHPLKNNEDFLRMVLIFWENTQGKLVIADEKLAKVYFSQHRLEEAAALYEQARSIREQSAQPSPDEVDQKAEKEYLAKHPEDVADYEKGRKVMAEAKRAAQYDLALTLSNLASCYAAQAKYDKAEPLYQRALGLFERANLTETPEAVSTMQFYALLLRKTGREEKARVMQEKASAAKKKFGQNSP